MSDEPVTDYDVEPGRYPAEFLQENRWFVWAYDDGRKIPRAPWANPDHHDKYVSWKDEANWVEFETASEWVDKLDRFELGTCIPPKESNESKRPVMFDFDNCRDPETGAIHPHAWAFIKTNDLAAFISTSGTGIHGYGWSSIPEGYKPSFEHDLDDWEYGDQFDEPASMEVYAGDRFCAQTGDHIADTPVSMPDVEGNVHGMFAEFGNEITTGVEREPDISRDEVEGMDTTDDVDDIYDAIRHVRPRDIQLRSPVTEEYGGHRDANYARDPSWAGSKSGTRLAEFDDHWLYRKGNHNLDALQVVALEERIISTETDYPSGDAFVDAVEALRGRGAHIPELEKTRRKSAAEMMVEEMDNENENDDVDEHEGDTDIEAAADGGAVAARSGDSGPSINKPSIEEQIRDKAVRPFAEDEIDQDWLIHRTAEVLDDELAWIHPRSDTRGWRTTLYNYVPQEGIYEPHGEAEAERIAERALGPVASNHRINELTSKLARMNRTRAKRLDEAPNRLVVDNGILDLTTGELSAYSSSEFHRARVDVEYEPEADCPKIDEFLHDVVETEADVETLYRFIAHALYKGYPDSKALMCLGEGSNGKTVFLELVEEFIGEFNTTNKSLQELSTNDFAAQKLSGKMANIEADMGDQDVKSLSMFKKLSGNGDTVDANVKFEESIEFNNHATLMFAANKMPILNDDTRGNWRRWVPMRFPNTFDAEDPDAKDPVDKAELKERLHADEEMRGLLAKCVEEIKRWHSDPSEPWFPNTPGWEDVRREMLAASNPVYEFATECLIKGEPDDEDISVPKAHVRKAYDRFAKERGLERLRPEEFGERLLNLRDFHVSANRQGAAKLQVYAGVDLNKLGERFADLLDEEVKESSEDGQNQSIEEAAEDDPAGGREKYEQIKDYVAREEKKNDGAVPAGSIVAKLTQWIGVAPDNAKQVIVEARKRGYIMEDGEDQYRAT